MRIRKTEQQLPSGFSATDLGETVMGPDDKTALISFNNNPVVIQRTQSYVVFVLDDTLSSQVENFEWSFENEDLSENVVTEAGYIEYQPGKEGQLSIKTTLKGSSGETLELLEIQQQVVPANSELEDLYEKEDEVAPLAGKPETSREVINDYKRYMDELAPRDTDPHSSLNRLLFAIAYVGVTALPANERNGKLEQIADSLDAGDVTIFAEEGGAGIGLCGIRPYILGMYLPETAGENDWYLEKKEFEPENTLSTDRELKKALTELPLEKQIDLFNLLRFPKSNLKMAIQLLHGLKDQYFPGENLESLITEKGNIKLLLDQFKKGPYKTS